MEISLIRHGKSNHAENHRITYKEFQGWIKTYDRSGVFEENYYPSKTLEKMATAKIVITSDLNRSIESAGLLTQDIPVVSHALFRETELPILQKRSGLKLNPKNWAVILRCLWFCGYSKQCESVANAKQRAVQASEQLMKYAEEHKSVVLVGHGFFNRLIAVELKKLGWEGKRRSSVKHWNCTTYTLER
jgi:broad specificity phosphatase PhoE